jgi:hypothetical protein
VPPAAHQTSPQRAREISSRERNGNSPHTRASYPARSRRKEITPALAPEITRSSNAPERI